MAAGAHGKHGEKVLNVTKYQMAPKPLITVNVLFLDGISRSGKKLSCRLLSQFSNIEYFNYISTVERECHRLALGHGDVDTAATNVQILIDEATYARAIGRNLNSRSSDESSILRAADSERYLQRAACADGQPAIDLFLKQNRVPLYHTHSVLPFIEVLFSAFPGAQVIHVTRNPIDIAEDWLRRGWGERWGRDPRAFGINAACGEAIVPWFAAAWAEDYANMTPSERCISSIIDLQEREQQAMARLTPKQKTQFLQFRLEHLLADPCGVLQKISSFTGQQPAATVEAFFRSEKLPNTSVAKTRENNLAILAKNARNDILERLAAANRAYEQHDN